MFLVILLDKTVSVRYDSPCIRTLAFCGEAKERGREEDAFISNAPVGSGAMPHGRGNPTGEHTLEVNKCLKNMFLFYIKTLIACALHDLKRHNTN